MNLHELLDSQTEFTVIKDTANTYKTCAEIGKGRRIIFIAEIDGPKKWDVMFLEESKKGDEHGYGGLTSKLTGSGKELQVFSFVKRSFEEFIKKHQPNIITFSSNKDDKSRTTLYKKLIKRYLPKEYELSIDDDSEDTDFWNSDIFTIRRKK